MALPSPSPEPGPRIETGRVALNIVRARRGPSFYIVDRAVSTGTGPVVNGGDPSHSLPAEAAQAVRRLLAVDANAENPAVVVVGEITLRVVPLDGAGSAQYVVFVERFGV